MTDNPIKAAPVPEEFATRYRAWKDGAFVENKEQFEQLAQGQSPSAMVISCCDSRVHVTALFGATQGDFFVHRNIANLVPPHGPEGAVRGTAAALEYAVNHLKVAHIMVVGHSLCGGVQGCYQMCSGEAPALEEEGSFIGRWMDFLRPGYERVKDLEGSERDRLEALEKENVKLSLTNLMSYPFVAKAVEGEVLQLHGLWTDIGSGGLQAYDPASDQFAQI